MEREVSGKKGHWLSEAKSLLHYRFKSSDSVASATSFKYIRSSSLEYPEGTIWHDSESFIFDLFPDVLPPASAEGSNHVGPV